jgi:flagellar biosynthesis/type III secretory pathway protein FliH
MGGKILDYEAKNILNKGISQGISQGRSQGISIGISQGRSQGISIGISQGENKLAQLINLLIADNRQEDIAKVTTDEAIRKEMYKKYGIVD